MDALDAKRKLKKDQRIRLVQVIVKETRHKYPNICRDEFKGIAARMVTKYPRSLKDAGKKGQDQIGSSFIEKKLKNRWDEELRAQKKKAANEAPNVPQAYGCVRWRVQIAQNTRPDLEKTREELKTTFNEVRSREWIWRDILDKMEQTYAVQREDINTQTPPKKRRARGAPHPPPTVQAMSTVDIARRWPFLFRPQGMLQHFKILTQKDLEAKFDEYQETAEHLVEYLAKKLGEEGIERRWRAAKDQIGKAATTLALFQLLVRYFKEQEDSIFREAEVKSCYIFHDIFSGSCERNIILMFTF